ETGLSPSSLGVLHDQPSSAEAIRAAEHELLIDIMWQNQYVLAPAVEEIAGLAYMVKEDETSLPDEFWKLSHGSVIRSSARCRLRLMPSRSSPLCFLRSSSTRLLLAVSPMTRWTACARRPRREWSQTSSTAWPVKARLLLRLPLSRQGADNQQAEHLFRGGK
ncbi:hypothetical protein, partial [Arthrobacter woluwensis]|uniref:hypothetical protein n=1 Tax=Arthrobacter woluwensis TaxID=156980 RepID=UPI001C316629